MENTLFIVKNPRTGVFGRRVALDDLILTTDMPTSAGSRMLEGFRSLFEAEVATRLKEAGWTITGKVNVGEFGVDLLGETSHFGAVTNGAGHLTSAAAVLLTDLDTDAVVGLEVNGTGARAAACSGQIHLKPTYGCISRYGTVAVACSGETIGISALDADTVADVLDAVAAHSTADGTSLPETACARLTGAGAAAGEAWAAPITRVLVARGLTATADAETRQLLEAAAAALRAQGITVAETSPETDRILAAAGEAWTILMSAELCNNVNRFEGVKYGYRSQDFLTIGELYTNSRTEAFGPVLKTLLLYGSEVLATDNYDSHYDRAMRIRRLICEALDAALAGGETKETAGQTAILLPACSKRAYTADDVAANPYLALEENRFTAPAAISGLPALTAGGVQLLGPAFSDRALLALAGAGAGTKASAAPAAADGKEV